MSDVLSLGSDLLSVGFGAVVGAVSGPSRTTPATTPKPMYVLSLRAPGALAAPIFFYVFPLTPASISRDADALTNCYFVQGDPSNFGVTAIPDIYGLSPPTFVLQGTTGVKFHSRDGFLFSGLQSANILQGLISQYFSLNAAQAAAGIPDLYTLEFYDYWKGEFWQVVPTGPVSFQQSNVRPQLIYYSLRLQGIISLENAILGAVDSLFSGADTPLSQASSSLNTSLGSTQSAYSPASVSADNLQLGGFF